MAFKFIPTGLGRSFVAQLLNKRESPAMQIARIQNAPRQVATYPQPERQQTTQSGPTTGYQDMLTRELNENVVAVTNPVLQPKTRLVAPQTIQDLSSWQQPYQTGNDFREYIRNAKAPPRLQSVPGYVVTQVEVTTSSINTSMAGMYRNLRAPNLNEKTNSVCKD